MKKKIIIGLLVFVAILLTSAVTYAVTSGMMSNQKHTPSDYKVGVSYDVAMKGNKPVVTLFYVDWCGYCLKFMPRFKTLESLYKDKYNFLMLNVEDPANEELAKDVVLVGYPTVYIIDPKYDNRFLLNNAIYLDLPKFRKELDRYLKIRSRLDSSPTCK